MNLRSIRSKRVVVALAMGALLVIGCLGQAERDFFDDSGEAGGPDVVVFGEGGNDGGDSSTADSGPTHKISGIVSGLIGTGLVLQLNGGGDKSVAPQGGTTATFTFDQRVAEGAAYAVTVKTQPSGPVQNCKVDGGVGAIGETDVTNVLVTCVTGEYLVGGNLTGLEGGITLHNSVTDGDGGAIGDGGDDLPLTANGGFTFPIPLKSEQVYTVSAPVHTGPQQTCTITNGTGKIVDQHITNVAVSCTTNAYTVGGAVTGLTGGTLELSSPNGGTVTRTSDGMFTLPTPVLSGQSYDVTVSMQPTMLTCRVTSPTGTGTVVSGPITNVTVTCVPRFALVENFDAVAVPLLPSGWTSLAVGAGNPDAFTTTNAASGGLGPFDTAPNSCAVPGQVNATDIVLTSPSFTVSSAFAKLSFRHAYDLEAGAAAYDGAVLEISTDGGGSWVDIITAGGTWDPPWKNAAGMVNVNYTGYSYAGDAALLISNSFQSPLPGRHAWTGVSGGYKLTTVNLPLASGASAKIRFRLATDKQVASIGWRVDTVSIAN
jgi:hypothetical protein